MNETYQRLTTEDAQDNLHILLNYAYVKETEIYLRYAGGQTDVPLALYIEQEAHKRGCAEVRRQSVVEGDDCFECEDCPLAVLNAVATQAAELRARLMQYEDIGGPPRSVKHLAELGRSLLETAKEREP